MSFFKKSVLTACLVFLLLTVLVVNSFASESFNLLSNNMNGWINNFPNNDFVIDTIRFTSSTRENRLTIPYVQDGVSKSSLLYQTVSSPSLTDTYKFSFQYCGTFNASFCFVAVSFKQVTSDMTLDDFKILTTLNQNIDTAHPLNFTVQFSAHSLGFSSADKISILFIFTKRQNSANQVYFYNLDLRQVTQEVDVDNGSWVGPDLQITDIDIENDISNIATSGGSLITFLQQGFTRVRVGVIGVASLFTSCWDYLTTYTPELTYIIVFGLVLGLLGMLISIFKFGKESGNTGKSSSSKSDKGGGSS